MSISLERMERRVNPQWVPEPVAAQPGLIQVDATWGTIEPMQVAEGVRTIGELEVLKHLEEGRPVVDSRTPDFYEKSTIPGTKNIPYPEATARMEELDQEHPAIFFCNGPQCGQSPTAVRALLYAGYPPEKILYYRGGLHDWLTLGLPVIPGESSQLSTQQPS